MLATYAPEDINLIINDYVITDFAQGSFVELNQNSKFYRQVRGIRGKHTRVRNRDRSGFITLRLMQTSPQNIVLSKLAQQDDFNQSGLLLVNLVDTSGTTGVQCGNAYLEGPPNLTFQSDSTTPNEWRIYYEFLTRYEIGGNQKGVLDFLSDIF